VSTRAPIRVLVALALVGALASCGGKSGSGDAGTTRTAGPGAGKPPVTIGTKNFPEAFLLGQLYAQALEAKGFRVNLKSNVGATEIIYRALTSSTLDMYPEYTGVVTAVVGNRRQRPRDEESAYREAQRITNARGLALLDHTPFSDRDAIAVKPEYARRWGLKSVADLAKVAGKVKFGGPPEFRTREQGYVGLGTVYGLTNLRFLPLRIGEQYQALNSGKVDAADVFTTDGELISGGYVVLKDPKGLFGFQNAAPFVRRSVVVREGPVFAQTLNAVSALLTTREMQRMNAAVVVQQKTPASVADAFLRDHRLK
jgi:osmoprotectant transport system substrate-binding protein